MSRPLTTKTYLALYCLVTLVSVCYFFAVAGTTFRAQLIRWNGETAFKIQHLPWAWLPVYGPSLAKGGYWIPYWCAVLLLFAYRERVKLTQWVLRFGAFLLAAASIVIVVNTTIALIAPQLCGRSSNLLHTEPHVNCRFLSPMATGIVSITLLTILLLEKGQWMVKLMLSICSAMISISFLYQGSYFPVQLICSLFLAVIIAVVAFLLLLPEDSAANPFNVF